MTSAPSASYWFSICNFIIQKINTVFFKRVKFIKEKDLHKDNISPDVCRTCCRCICCPPVPSVAAHKWPREDLSLLPPKPFNTHPTAAETEYITKGNIHKLWPRRTHGKLSYEQSGAVLKGVTWRDGDVSIPGGAGCPSPVLVALETSPGPSRSAFWGPSLGSYCVVGDTNDLAAPPGPPHLSPQVPTVDHVWLMSFKSLC